MTVTRSTTRVLAVALACAAAAPAHAEGVVFRFSKVLYTDDKEVRLRAPEGVGCSEDRIVVADSGNGRLVVYRLSEGGVVSPGHAVKVGELKYPTRVVVDAKGTSFVLDGRARKIGRVSADGKFEGWIQPKDAPGFLPVSFALTPGGNVVALDGAGRAAVEMDLQGAVLRRVPLPPGQFLDLVVDAQGGILAVEAVTATVWTAAKAEAAFKPLTRSLKEMTNFPAQIVTSGRGRLFLADRNGMGIVVLGLDGGYQGRQLTMGWEQGQVYYPAQLCVNGRGETVVADRGNNRVQVFTTLE